jgi:hypothetical protein
MLYENWFVIMLDTKGIVNTASLNMSFNFDKER